MNLSLNERLKLTRTYFKKTQADFANMLGIGQTTLAMMEVGKRNILDRHIKVICSVCNVNETWLRTGEGEMFIQRDQSIIEALAAEYMLNNREMHIIEVFASMDEQKRQALMSAFLDFADALKQGFEPAAAAQDEIEKELADYRAELEAQQAEQAAASATNGEKLA